MRAFPWARVSPCRYLDFSPLCGIRFPYRLLCASRRLRAIDNANALGRKQAYELCVIVFHGHARQGRHNFSMESFHLDALTDELLALGDLHAERLVAKTQEHVYQDQNERQSSQRSQKADSL
jgi:hypothetical protein